MKPRLIYENDTTRAKEKRVADFLIERWGLSHAKHLTMAYGLDWAMVKDAKEREVLCFVEIKVRSPKIWFNFGDGYYISAQKIIKARHLNEETHKPCYIAVNFEKDDSVYVTSIFNHLPGCIISGRTDRLDEHDEEPELVYPWSCFKRLR